VSRRLAPRLAWSLCGSAVALHVAGGILTAIGPDPSVASEYPVAVALLVLSVVGAFVAARRPGNAIGWLFCVAGLLIAASGTSYAYADYVLVEQPGLAGGVAAAWLTSWVFLPALYGVPPLLFLLFPDGRPLRPAWRIAVTVTVASLVCQCTAAAFRPGALQDAPVAGLENPVGIDVRAWTEVVELTGWTLGLLSIVLGAWSLVLRYRRSRGDERLQLRWVVSSAVLFGGACLVSAVLFQTRFTGLGQAFVFTAFLTIPVAAGIAILRYRLYDIDVVINRTLVYATLTLTLAGVYLGSVLILQLALNPLAVQSDLAVAASTLAVAALFGPARRRIQGGVDKRFFRSQYDAARTVDAFAGQLRHEVDLDAVGDDLRAAVLDTVQPTHVWLWVRS